jgi:hypothetical protein
MICRTLGSTGDKVSAIGVSGRFEPFKTSSIFDGTAENPQRLGEEPPEIRELMPA